MGFKEDMEEKEYEGINFITIEDVKERHGDKEFYNWYYHLVRFEDVEKLHEKLKESLCSDCGHDDCDCDWQVLNRKNIALKKELENERQNKNNT